MNFDTLEKYIQSNQLSKKIALNFLAEIEKKIEQQADKKILHKFLGLSRKTQYLQALETTENIRRWADLTFKIIRYTNFTFLDLFKQRLEEHPNKALFLEKSSSVYRKWTYKQIFAHAKEIAAFFYKKQPKSPKVLIFMQNSIESAVVDLACLMFNIFDTPLNIHFNLENFSYVLNLIDFDFIVVDSIARYKIAKQAVEKIGKKISIVTNNKKLYEQFDVEYFLPKECKKITKAETDKILSEIVIPPVNQVATTMFTSGSTGIPKGVSFSIYNIVTKRFARAAALPQVGDNEVFVCYLPLFHTFGRYLELTGTIFWGGTYVMANNPSIAALTKIFPEVNPTGFISVPVRWTQFYEKITEKLTGNETDLQIKTIIEKFMGKNLKWGLSAAGYLDPKIFKFFHKYGISLNSGFGMTEATGGITMTPPFEYHENSVGLPLPGMKTRLTDENELELQSHYLARYLEDAKPNDIIPYPDEDDYWLKTGDIFLIHENGHHQIIDRLKDIYKNNKGQTISPRTAEAKFDGVQGIKRTFLIGDGKPYNVLLIVPDEKANVLNIMKDEKNRHEYFRQIVIAANADLAPYERIINFAVIDRDFSIEKGELTPKGSFKRKKIEENFAETIKNLYKANFISFNIVDYQIIVPRWLIRDLGILETDFAFENNFLINKVSNKKLRIEVCKEKQYIVVGDLAYNIVGKKIDIGRIVRQPKLWIGNPQLTDFAPCMANFDLPLKNFTQQICLPENRNRYSAGKIKHASGINDTELLFLDKLLSTILHSDDETALLNLKQLKQLTHSYEKDKINIIHRRVEALACHQSEKIRAFAYQFLVTCSPDVDYSEVLPSFINSGKTFLTETSIKNIAQSSIDLQQLQALRRRLFAYRKGLDWPANKTISEQFDKIFKLLFNFGLKYPEYYKAIRAEFAAWELFTKDPYLSEKAKNYFIELHKEFEKNIAERTQYVPVREWKKFFVFDEGISDKSKNALIDKLRKNHFLKISVFLTYDDFGFSYDTLTANCIRISRLKSYKNAKHYRMSINTENGKHFDIHISIGSNSTSSHRIRMIHRYIALSGFPVDASVMAKFGYLNADENIYSTRYISQLSAWDKIRSMAEIQKIGYIDDKNFWRKIFIRSISVFFKAWNNSDQEIIPGFVAPENVIVPEVDFSDNVKIISLSGYKKFDTIKTLISAIYSNFYQKTEAHYPSLKRYLKTTWLFHAIVEIFGKDEALLFIHKFIDEIQNQSKKTKLDVFLLCEAQNYIKISAKKHYLPLALFNAIDKYKDWEKRNSYATTFAKLQTIDELYELYKLNRYPEIVRYRFYRETYFADANKKIKDIFDKILQRMIDEPEVLAFQLTELSDLQAELTTEAEKTVFNKLLFPDIKEKAKINVKKVGDKKNEHIVIYSKIYDKFNVEYTMREPVDAADIGEIYKLFFKENYPKEISAMDKHYVVTNANEQVIAGLCYKELEDNIVLIDGMAVTASLQGKGIGSAMMNDFFSRMKAKGFKFVKAHFLFGNYYLKHNFVIDKKWGALVREL